MRLLHILIPTLLLGAFGAIYYQDHARHTQHQHEQTTARATAEAKERQEREATEQRTRDETARRTAEREAAEKKKEADRLAQWEADNATLLSETTRHTTRATTQNAEIATLEKQLHELRETTARLTRENHTLAQDTEAKTLTRRTAELETLRLIEHLTQRLAKQSLANSQNPVPKHSKN